MAQAKMEFRQHCRMGEYGIGVWPRDGDDRSRGIPGRVSELQSQIAWSCVQPCKDAAQGAAFVRHQRSSHGGVGNRLVLFLAGPHHCGRQPDRDDRGGSALSWARPLAGPVGHGHTAGPACEVPEVSSGMGSPGPEHLAEVPARPAACRTPRKMEVKPETDTLTSLQL